MLENKIQLFTLILFLALFFLTYLVPIADIDFWWHIASGRYILESWDIPSVDPFLVFDDSNPVRNNTVLKGQWLGQVILYSVYSHFSDIGLMALRALILISGLIFIYYRMHMLKLSGLSMWLLMLAAALILQGYTGERPQLFSFLFFGLLLMFWDVFRTRGNRLWLLLFPIIFALWSNIHGGFLLGIVVIGLLVGAKALTDFITTNSWLNLLSWGAFILILVLASMINPNGWDAYFYLLQLEGSELQNRTSEYVGSLAIYQYGLWFEQVVVAMFLMLGLAGAVYALRQRAWDNFVLITLLMLISLSAYRYLVFFVIAASPYIAQSFVGMENKLRKSIVAYDLRLAWSSLIGVSIALATYVLLNHSLPSNDRFSELNKGLMLIKQKQGSGYAFNTMNIGGYLIWHLGPRIRTFIDGRMLNEKKLVPYTHILWTTDHGKKWFDQNRFNWVIMSTGNQFTGELYSLVPYLQTQPSWRVVYQTEDWIIFEKILR